MKTYKLLKKEVLIIIFLALIFLQIINVSSDVKTGINISNSAPYLLKPIPNQSWAVNTNLIRVLDLDDYFFDNEEIILNYSFLAVENISIQIDSSNNVSFYPDLNFVGNRTTIFYAYDGNFNTSSNLVYLNVNVDNQPPQWNSPSKNRNIIYQNSYVNFTTQWTDNVGLKNYIFSINQGSWVNYSGGNFSGLSNTSTYRIQISASGGSIVYWKFCANDTSDNLNCTDIQSFNVSSRNLPSPTPPSVFETYGFTGTLRKKIKNFSIDISAFKISLKQGSTETRILEITNVGDTNLSFNLSVSGVNDFVTLSEYSFKIPVGKKKRITIDFSATRNTPPGQYFGELIVESTSGTVKVPIVIDINLLDLKFDVNVNISEKYKTVRPGKIVKANITIKSVKDLILTNLTFYIALKDLYGNIYDSSEEEFLFSSYLSLERNLTVPSNVKAGEYIFYARASNEETMAIDSDFFEVGLRFKFAAFLKSSFIFILIVILSIFAITLILKYRKEKEKERILSLYLMINELKNLIKEGKFDSALELYIRIKTAYGEPVSKSTLENKEKLKDEIAKLSKKLKTEMKEVKEDTQKSEKQEKVQKDKESKPKIIKEKPIQEKQAEEKRKKSEEKIENKKDLRKNAIKKSLKTKPIKEIKKAKTSNQSSISLKNNTKKIEQK